MIALFESCNSGNSTITKSKGLFQGSVKKKIALLCELRRQEWGSTLPWTGLALTISKLPANSCKTHTCVKMHSAESEQSRRRPLDRAMLDRAPEVEQAK